MKGDAAKRTFDLTIALLLVVPAAVICAVAATVIWLDDRAHPLFVQTRLGRDEQPFRLVKLRTMRVGTGDRPSHEAGRHHITRIGELLHRTKLDELPQLWNVLRGEMSFVGPRPGLPSQVHLATNGRQHGVHCLLPGITGVSQVCNVDMSTPDFLAETDADYLVNWSIRRDVGLLLKTALGSGRGDAAKL